MSERHEFSFQGPLHEQVHKALRARIIAGEWEPREPLPGEAWLSRELGVSIGTVRKAMDQLTRENIVVRERGRGTFVRQDAEWRTSSAFRLCDSEGQTITPVIRVVGNDIAIATQAEAAALKIRSRNKSSPSILRLHREWLRNDQILCRETIVVETARFPRLRQAVDETADTFFAIYAEVYRHTVDRMQWAIGTPDCASLCAAGEDRQSDGSLLIKRIALDARGVPLEVCEQRVVIGKCHVQITR